MARNVPTQMELPHVDWPPVQTSPLQLIKPLATPKYQQAACTQLQIAALRTTQLVPIHQLVQTMLQRELIAMRLLVQPLAVKAANLLQELLHARFELVLEASLLLIKMLVILTKLAVNLFQPQLLVSMHHPPAPTHLLVLTMLLNVQAVKALIMVLPQPSDVLMLMVLPHAL